MIYGKSLKMGGLKGEGGFSKKGAGKSLAQIILISFIG